MGLLNQQFPLSFNHLVDPLYILFHILHIFASLDPVFTRNHPFGSGARAAADDGLPLLHNNAKSVITLYYRVLLDFSTFSKFYY